jgi:hypothetical protein
VDESTAWAVLGIAPGASRRQVRKRYVALAREVHPDRAAHQGPAAAAHARERMTQINLAWELLSVVIPLDPEMSIGEHMVFLPGAAAEAELEIDPDSDPDTLADDDLELEADDDEDEDDDPTVEEDLPLEWVDQDDVSLPDPT